MIRVKIEVRSDTPPIEGFEYALQPQTPLLLVGADCADAFMAADLVIAIGDVLCKYADAEDDVRRTALQELQEK